MYKFHFGISVYVNAALAIGQKEQVGFFVPRYLIDFKFELLFGYNLMRANINERNKVFFVANSYGFTVWSPGNIDVFTFGGNGSSSL